MENNYVVFNSFDIVVLVVLGIGFLDRKINNVFVEISSINVLC